ncbi:MAG: dUTP diphosphatase [Bdellovibrionales bacterium]
MPNPVAVSNKVTLKIKRLPHSAGLPLPAHQTPAAACIDLICAIEGEKVLQPGERYAFPTGLCFAIPDGYHGQVWPRSGLAVKNGIDTMAGMIDSDYRGELLVALVNHSKEPFTFTRGMRMAQFLIAPYAHNTVVEVEELGDTDRGAGGFGSTGGAGQAA